jgi:hypothetical protein
LACLTCLITAITETNLHCVLVYSFYKIYFKNIQPLEYKMFIFSNIFWDGSRAYHFNHITLRNQFHKSVSSICVNVPQRDRCKCKPRHDDDTTTTRRRHDDTTTRHSFVPIYRPPKSPWLELGLYI